MKLMSAAINAKHAARLAGIPVLDVVRLYQMRLVFGSVDRAGLVYVSDTAVPRLRQLARKHLKHRVTVLPQGIFTETTKRSGNK